MLKTNGPSLEHRCFQGSYAAYLVISLMFHPLIPKLVMFSQGYGNLLRILFLKPICLYHLVRSFTRWTIGPLPETHPTQKIRITNICGRNYSYLV